LNPTDYFWFYGLIELALILLVIAMLFALAWWRLWRERRRLKQVCRRVDVLCSQALQGARDERLAVDERQQTHLACLQSLRTPFRRQQLADDALWSDLLNQIQDLAKAGAYVERVEVAAPSVAVESPAEEAEQSDSEEAVELDQQIETVYAQYQAGRQALLATREAKAELEQRYAELLDADQQLSQRLQNLKRDESEISWLRRELDHFVRSNQDFMRAAVTSECSQRALESEFSALVERIGAMQDSLTRYRQSNHKLLLDRDALAEERKRLLMQLKMNERLVARLNRNYNALHREYTRLYESTH